MHVHTVETPVMHISFKTLDFFKGRKKVFCQRAKKAEALKDINFNAVSVQNLHKGSDIYLFY